MENKLPDFSKHIDINAFFINEFGGCGCSDVEEMINVIRDLLEWVSKNPEKRKRFDELFDGNTGIFYILIGQLDRLDLCEHGTSIRHPFLTQKGEDLLNSLKTMDSAEIENSSGEAYDGLYYD